jgi:hypothetical protein
VLAPTLCKVIQNGRAGSGGEDGRVLWLGWKHLSKEVGSQKELGEGPGVVDLQRCWGFPEQSYNGRI